MTYEEKQTNLIPAISRTLELISSTQDMIESLRKTGEKEDGLMIRQYKHLKSVYVKELDGLLQRLDVDLHLEEVS